MLASVWNWPTLDYSYYILENQDPDLGGFDPVKGIHGKSQVANGVSCIEDCLPSLPSNAYFVMNGSDCVGEVYEKRDAEPRPRLDLIKIENSQDDLMKRLISIIKEDSVIRENAVGGFKLKPSGNDSKAESEAIYIESNKIVWERLIPIIASLGIGFSFFKFTEKNLRLRNVALAWIAGVSIGISVGKESVKQNIIRGKKK